MKKLVLFVVSFLTAYLPTQAWAQGNLGNKWTEMDAITLDGAVSRKNLYTNKVSLNAGFSLKKAEMLIDLALFIGDLSKTSKIFVTCKPSSGRELNSIPFRYLNQCGV